MKSISVDVVRPLLHPDGVLYLDEDYILCSPDIPVHENLLKRLKEWNFKTILIDESVKPNISSLPQNLSEGDVTDVFWKIRQRTPKTGKKPRNSTWNSWKNYNKASTTLPKKTP